MLCWSLSYTNMNQPQVYVCRLPLQPPSHPPVPLNPIFFFFFGGITMQHMDLPHQGQNSCSLAQTVKNLPALQETQVPSLGQDYPLEQGLATHSSILAWQIPLTEEPGGLQSMGSQIVGHDRATFTFVLTHQSTREISV